MGMSNQKICFMLIGLPCVGKSTYIAQHNVPAKNVVSSDVFIERYARLVRSDYTGVFNDRIATRAMDFMNRKVRKLIASEDLIFWDQTNLTVKSRRSKILMLKDAGYKVYGVYFELNEEEHMRRIASRPDKRIPQDVMNSMIRNYVRPSVDEGFDDIFPSLNDKKEV